MSCCLKHRVARGGSALVYIYICTAFDLHDLSVHGFNPMWGVVNYYESLLCVTSPC